MIRRFDGLFKTYSINEGYVTVSEKEIDDVIKQLNELHNKYVDEFALRETLQLELQRVEEENRELQEIINDIFNFLLKTDFAKKEYCNALLRIIGEENDVEKTKQRIKEFIYD